MKTIICEKGTHSLLLQQQQTVRPFFTYNCLAVKFFLRNQAKSVDHTNISSIRTSRLFGHCINVFTLILNTDI